MKGKNSPRNEEEEEKKGPSPSNEQPLTKTEEIVLENRDALAKNPCMK